MRCNPLGSTWIRKTPNELVRLERHGLVALAALEPVVLALEPDAVAISRDQAGVGDCHAVGVARKVGQHDLGPGEWFFGKNRPFGLAQGRQQAGKGLRLGKIS